ncbi:MAG: DUF2860 domain-containing protein [Alphaproteobacteria bacterium]|nr:DUF2860 domain-containing protein [Alphaproteobacteria bacterium]
MFRWALTFERSRWLRWPASFLVGALLTMVLAAPTTAETVSYEDILANPDDVKLSYLYAQQQVIKGDLEQASASLERVLLLQPNWDTARLFYAAVLFRMDDMLGAKRELKLLLDRPLNAAQEREVKKYLALTTARSKQTRLTARITGGFKVDSNPDLTTSSSNDLNGGVLDTNSRVDGAFMAGSRVRLEHTIPNGTGSFGFIELNSNLNEQFSVSEADNINARLRAGASLFHNDLQVTPYAVGALLALRGDLYRSEYGGGVASRYVINPQLSVFGGIEGIYQDYSVVSEDSVGSARNGWLGEASGGFTYRSSEKNRLTARIKGYQKDARNDSYSYDAIEVMVRDVLLLGRGQYVSGTASYRWTNYDQPDPTYSATVTRKDRIFKARLAYGLPLGTLFEWFNMTTGDAVADVNFQVGVNYLNWESNIPNFDANSVSADVLFTKNFTY